MSSAKSRPSHEDDWLFLFYFCGDYADDSRILLRKAIRDIEGLQKLSTSLDVAYQFDAYTDEDIQELRLTDPPVPNEHQCVRRHLRWTNRQHEEREEQQQSSWKTVKHTAYKTINTGTTETLREFFEWARAPITEARNLAVVFAGLGVGDKRSVIGNIDRDQDFGRLFSICDDNSDKDAISPIEVQEALELLVNEFRDGEPIDVLGFDMSSMQYIEVAYQFTGLARVMVASQNNGHEPFWPYDRLLSKTANHISAPDTNKFIGPMQIGSLFVDTMMEELQAQFPQADANADFPIVSAIDIGRLDIVARSLDTLFLNLLQALGDEAIWMSRDAAFRELRQLHQRADNLSRSRSLVAYDLLELLRVLSRHLEKIKTTSGVFQAWYDEQLRELHDPDAVDQHFDRKCGDLDDTGDGNASDSCCSKSYRVRSRVEEIVKQNTQQDDAETTAQLHEFLQQLEFDEKLHAYSQCVQDQHDTTQDHVTHGEGRQKQLLCADQDTHAFLHQLKERFDRLGKAEMERSAKTAEHLLDITKDVISLVTPPNRAIAQEPNNRKQPARCILAQYTHVDRASTLPRERCGISIYRPEHLDRLAESQYLDFAFHRRVHWVSLLAAINLIRKHAGQLWHVVSSLLSTCTGAGRDELLQRLAGPRSVMHRFGKQFRALQNPLTLTLTISEPRDIRQIGPNTTDHTRHKDSASDANQTDEGSKPEPQLPSYFDAEQTLTYKLTLETNRPDAFVDTSTAVLSRKRVQNALDRLEAIIAPSRNGRHGGQEVMEDFARDLGEDILRGLDLSVHNGETDAVPHLHLQLPVHLMGLPWEVMDEGRRSTSEDKDRMLCDRFAISRQTLLDSGVARPPGYRTSTKIRALIIGNPTLSQATVNEFGAGQLPGAEDEAHEVARLFRQLSRDLRGTIELDDMDVQINTTITCHDVRKSLRSGTYDIVHFAGHAMHNEQSPERSFWLLSDGALWAQGIANTLANCMSPPWLVYANACESAMGSNSTAHHRTNVYGLGSAFTNNGVTAYLGPLWPIGDFVGGQLATDFYKGLLLERATIGESLFVAKRNAKQRLEGTLADDLSWASMIAYGDSRLKLLDSLGLEPPENNPVPSADSHQAYQPASDRQPKRLRKFSAAGQPVEPMQASVRSTRLEIVEHPLCRPAHQHAEHLTQVDEQEVALELRQINGVRFWQFMRHREIEFSGVPDTPLKPELETNQRLQYRLGIRDADDIDANSRLVGHWRIPLDAGRNFHKVLESYDSVAVSREGLVHVTRESDTAPLDSLEIRRLYGRFQKRTSGRILLLLHDGLGSTEAMVRALGQQFIRQASRHYLAILGFDHWSLQRNVADSADLLRDELKELGTKESSDNQLRPNAIDIIGFGRGGLVGRSLIELNDHGGPHDVRFQQLVRSIAMVGTPNASSRLANPKNWGPAADVLANTTHLDSTGSYARLSSALAQLAVLKKFTKSTTLIERAAGLLMADTPDDPWPYAAAQHVRYAAVAAAYAPGAAVSVPRIIREHCLQNPFFQHQHDLVVATNDIWPRANNASNDCTEFTTPEPTFPTLLIAPADNSFYSNGDPDGDRSKRGFDIPENIERVEEDGIHHTDLLSHAACHKFLKHQLFTELEGGQHG